jgi:hypothetical protein
MKVNNKVSLPAYTKAGKAVDLTAAAQIISDLTRQTDWIPGGRIETKDPAMASVQKYFRGPENPDAKVHPIDRAYKNLTDLFSPPAKKINFANLDTINEVNKKYGSHSLSIPELSLIKEMHNEIDNIYKLNLASNNNDVSDPINKIVSDLYGSNKYQTDPSTPVTAFHILLDQTFGPLPKFFIDPEGINTEFNSFEKMPGLTNVDKPDLKLESPYLQSKEVLNSKLKPSGKDLANKDERSETQEEKAILPKKAKSFTEKMADIFKIRVNSLRSGSIPKLSGLIK